MKDLTGFFMVILALFAMFFCELATALDEDIFLAKAKAGALKVSFIDKESWDSIQKDNKIKRRAIRNRKILKAISRKVGWIGGALIVIDAYCSFFDCKVKKEDERDGNPD